MRHEREKVGRRALHDCVLAEGPTAAMIENEEIYLEIVCRLGEMKMMERKVLS